MIHTRKWKETQKAWAGKILALCLCLPVLALLTGCGDGKVQSTVSEVVSRLGDDVSETVSRVEDALDGNDSSSRDGASTLDETSGLVSGGDGNLDSDLADDGVVDGDRTDDSAASRDGNSKVTKDR